MWVVAKVFLPYRSDSSREVLNKKLAEVVQCVKLTSLRYEGRDTENSAVQALRGYLVNQLPLK